VTCSCASCPQCAPLTPASLVQDGDISPGIAAGLFVAFKQGMLSATAENLRTVIAVGALVLPVVNILLRREYTNRDIGVFAPATLAAEALNIMSITPAAVAAYGTILCESLAGVFSFQGSYYAVLATLAAAVYYNLGGVWVTCALLISQGASSCWRLSGRCLNIDVTALLTLEWAIWPDPALLCAV
jgi:hypothetical protein